MSSRRFRRIGHPAVVRMRLFGTAASFGANSAGSMGLTKDPAQARRLDDELAPRGVTTKHGMYQNLSPVHPVERLPREFANLPSGHEGSHAFLVDDFVRACVEGTTLPNNVWMAARSVLPGLVAHESAVAENCWRYPTSATRLQDVDGTPRPGPS